MLKFSSRRLIALALWGMTIYWMRLDQGFERLFESFTFHTEFSLFILLLTYWLGDSLSVDRLATWHKKALLQKYQKTLFHLRLQLPILLLIAFQFGILQIVDRVFFEHFGWQKDLLIFVMNLLIMVAASPMMMVLCWGAQALSSKHAEQIIQNELKASKVSVRRVLSWPEHIISATTAGVIGIIPGCRYLLISEQLLQTLSTDELRAVIAHEAGHIRKSHLLFFLLGFVAFIAFLTLSSYIADQYFWLFIWETTIWFYAILVMLSFFLFIRVILGFLSRNFERQADCNSLEKVGFDPFKQALLKVAWLNGIDPEMDNWHHYGIQQRLKFLAECVDIPKRIQNHHQRVFKIKLACLGLVAMLLGVNVYGMSDAVRLKFSEYLLPQYLHSLDQLKTENPDLLKRMTRLATNYQVDNQVEQAEPIYRRILDITPNDALVLNNLAWLLAIHYEDHPEKIEESIQLTRLAIEQENVAFIWDTLAEGYLKIGKNQQAWEAAQQALRLAKQGMGLSPQAGLEYYQERSAYFLQFVEPDHQR